MHISTHQNLLCSYRYDALDRSISWAPIQQAGIQRFYCKDRLASEIQGVAKRSIFQHDDQVLAQRQHMDDKIDISLLTTDLQGSVLNALDAHRLHPIAYMPYGHRLPGNGLLSLLGFNGERPDPVTGHYHLGHGYRQFNPVLMRFNSPDNLSPFGKGGLNAYVYCGGNPVNRADPNGHVYKLIASINEEFLGIVNRPMSKTTEAWIIKSKFKLRKLDSPEGRNQVYKNIVEYSNSYTSGTDISDIMRYKNMRVVSVNERKILHQNLNYSMDTVNEKIALGDDMLLINQHTEYILSQRKYLDRSLSHLTEMRKHLDSLPNSMNNPTSSKIVSKIRGEPKQKME